MQRIGSEHVVYLNKGFKKLSKVLTDGSNTFCFFRGRICLEDEDIYNILLLSTDVKGNYKNIDLSVDMNPGEDKIYYSRKMHPFRNERDIISALDTVLQEYLDILEDVAIRNIYWDISDVVNITEGYILECKDDDRYDIVLSNKQSSSYNYEFSEGIKTINGDIMMIQDWSERSLYVLEKNI